MSWHRPVVLVAAFAAFPTAVYAEGPTILVLPYQAMGKDIDPELTEQTTVVVTEEMKAMGLGIVRADDGVGQASKKSGGESKRGKDKPTGDPSAAKSAQKLIDEGDDYLQDEEFGKAIKKLERAVTILERNGDAVPDLRLLPQAYLKLSIALFRNGDEDEADDALNKSVHYDPDRTLSDTEYPPIFIKVHERARFNVLRRPRARVEVRAPKGAQVLLDGRNLGKAPLVLKDTLPGEHWIRVEVPPKEILVKKVMLRSKRTILVDFGADGAAADEGSGDLFGAMQKNEIQRAHVEALQAAGQKNNADYVMFGSMYKTRTAYNIYTLLVRVKDGKVGRLVDIAFDLDMLSAQIEVYKLAEDTKKETSKDLSRPEEQLVFAMAPKVKLRKSRSRAKEDRITEVAAAPAPIPNPMSQVASREPATGDSRVQKPGSTVVPKDEKGRLSKNESSDLIASTVIPKDEEEDDDGDSDWLLWVLAGVAVVGAGAGGVLLLSGGSSDEAALRLSW